MWETLARNISSSKLTSTRVTIYRVSLVGQGGGDRQMHCLPLGILSWVYKITCHQELSFLESRQCGKQQVSSILGNRVKWIKTLHMGKIVWEESTYLPCMHQTWFNIQQLIWSQSIIVIPEQKGRSTLWIEQNEI